MKITPHLSVHSASKHRLLSLCGRERALVRAQNPGTPPRTQCASPVGGPSHNQASPPGLSLAGEVNSWVRVSRRAANSPERRGRSGRRAASGHLRRRTGTLSARPGTGEDRPPPITHEQAVAFPSSRLARFELSPAQAQRPSGHRPRSSPRGGEEALLREKAPDLTVGNQRPSVPWPDSPLPQVSPVRRDWGNRAKGGCPPSPRVP